MLWEILQKALLSVVEIWNLCFCLVQMSSNLEPLSNLPISSNSRTLTYTELQWFNTLLLCQLVKLSRLKLELVAVKDLACVGLGQNLTPVVAYLPSLNRPNKHINSDFNSIKYNYNYHFNSFNT
jgi:hypothetical protein